MYIFVYLCGTGNDDDDNVDDDDNINKKHKNHKKHKKHKNHNNHYHHHDDNHSECDSESFSKSDPDNNIKTENVLLELEELQLQRNDHIEHNLNMCFN